jgi:hypothetical protein
MFRVGGYSWLECSIDICVMGSMVVIRLVVCWALDEVHRGSCGWLYDGACAMFRVGGYSWLEGWIDIFVMVVGDHGGD